MIKKIKEIIDFGIYKNFKWDEVKDLKEFNKKNIIYGWNYSGKTTLSRIFSALRDKRIDEKYKDGKFKIVFDNEELTQDNLTSFPYNVCIFNSEYILNNLKWDKDEKLDAIAFDVGENVAKRKEIENNQKKIVGIVGDKTTAGRKKKYEEKKLDFSKFESEKFTNESRKIKNDIFNSVIEFNKGHLKAVLNEIGSNVDSNHISDVEAVNRLKKTSIAINDKSRIDDVVFDGEIENFYNKVVEILKSTPPQEEIIQVLEDNSALYAWAKDGYTHHNDKLDECAFCGNKISKERLVRLNNYFSNQSAQLRKSIQLLKEEMDNEKKALNIINLPKSKNDFVDSCQSLFESNINKFKTIKKEYIDFLEKLKKELERKEDGNIFSSIESIPYQNEILSNMTQWKNSLNEIIKSHNSFIAKFDSHQSEARDKLKRHCVAKFLIEEKYKQKEKIAKLAQKHIDKFNAIVTELNEKNAKLESELKSIVAGKEELNKFIKAFLNRDDIYIDVTDEDKFMLIRGGKKAENLSEGEKTAISFAYFLTNLEGLHREKKLSESIIFIDDPISSLDANHIAHIYSLINSFFFRKCENPDNLEQAVECFKQLFISTHNFEFFSFLKDSTQLKKKNTISGCEYYFIKRIGIDNSSIYPLPKNLLRKSEYIYLFEILFNFYEDNCPMDEEHALLIPNALRRFFEMYTLIKIPDSTGEIDSRLSILMGGQHNLKVLHHFSHFTTFEKVMKHDELLMILPQAMNEFMTLLQKDTIHFEALKRAISKT